MNSHRGLASRSKAVANLFRGRPGRRPICTHFYSTHREYIWTAWSRMNLEAARGSAALKWRCKHVSLFLMGPLLSQRHFLKSNSAENPPNPPNPSNWLARMLSVITNELTPRYPN
jgi:hypothetical protein